MTVAPKKKKTRIGSLSDINLVLLKDHSCYQIGKDRFNLPIFDKKEMTATCH